MRKVNVTYKPIDWAAADKKDDVPEKKVHVAYKSTEWQPPVKSVKTEDYPQKKVHVESKPKEWENIGFAAPIPLRHFKGINTFLDAVSLEDPFATRTKNITSTNYPAFSVRSGYTVLGASLGSSIQGIGIWQDAEIHAFANGGWNKWTGAAWSSLATGLNAVNPWSFCNFKGSFATMNMLAANGIDPMKRYDGTSVVNVATAPAGANFVDQHDNRAYCAVGNTLYASSLRKADDWTTAKDSSQIVVENPKGELISGLKAGAGHIIVFLPSSIYELWGTGFKDFRMQMVANDIGLTNNQAAVNLNGILYFLDIRHLYRYSGGTRPAYDFSLPVQAYIDQINPAAKDKCSIGSDGKKLYISIPYQTSTTANVTIEYDPNFDIWNVWQDFTPTAFARMGNDWFIGDNTGRILKMGGSTTDNGTPVSWEWVSKPFGSDVRTRYGTVIPMPLSQHVQWHSLWYVADIPAGSNIDVYLSRSPAGDADWVLARSLWPSSSMQTGKVMIPVGSLANANWVRVRMVGNGPVIVHEIDRQVRDIPLI